MHVLLRSQPAILCLFVAGAARAAAPSITSFTPESGPIGTFVAVTGSAFTGVTAVTIGGAAAHFVVSSATQLTATLPATAKGPIAVTTGSGTGTSSASFTVTPGAQASLAYAHPSQTLTVTASGFHNYSSMDVYFDTTDAMLAISNGSGVATATITVPATASPGKHWITFDERATHIAAQTALLVNTDWAQGGYNAADNAFNRFEPTVSTSTVGGLETEWSIYHGSNPTQTVEVGGTLYAGDATGIVRAISSTGTLTWTASTGYDMAGISPVTGGGYVIFGGGTKVFAFKENCGVGGATCKPAWIEDIGFNVSGGLTYRAGLIYAACSDSYIHVLNVTTGAAVSSYTENANSGAITSPVSFDADGSSFYFAGGTYSFIDYQNGGAGSGAYLTPVSGIAIASGSSYFVTASSYNGSGDASLIKSNVPFADTGDAGCPPATPVVANNVVYTAVCSTLTAFNSSTGAQIWQNTAFYTGTFAVLRNVSLANGVLYACGYPSVSATNGVLFAYDASYGNVLWSGGMCNGVPVIANGTLYGGAGYLSAYTLPSLMPNARAKRPIPSLLAPNLALTAERTRD